MKEYIIIVYLADKDLEKIIGDLVYRFKKKNKANSQILEKVIKEN